MNKHAFTLRSHGTLAALGATIMLSILLVVPVAHAQAPAAEATGGASSPATPSSAAPAQAKHDDFRLGAHAELDLGILLAMKQGAAFAGGVVWGPFRAGMSYATFLSNKSFGGTPARRPHKRPSLPSLHTRSSFVFG
jgi:hypothetical protein